MSTLINLSKELKIQLVPCKDKLFTKIKMQSLLSTQLHYIYACVDRCSKRLKEVNESLAHDVHPQLLDVEK